MQSIIIAVALCLGVCHAQNQLGVSMEVARATSIEQADLDSFATTASGIIATSLGDTKFAKLQLSQVPSDTAGNIIVTGFFPDVPSAEVGQFAAQLGPMLNDLKGQYGALIGMLLKSTFIDWEVVTTSTATPEPAAEGEPTECVDDPTGDVAANSVTCDGLKGMLPCSYDLAQLVAVPEGTLLSLVCPVTCNACPATDAPTEAAADTACKDDPTGEVAAAGSSCAALVGMGCGLDLSTMDPTLEKGTFVSLACPLSCDACPSAAEAATDAPTEAATEAATDVPTEPATVPPEPKAAPDPALCVDDPTGDIAAAGASCPMLAGMGCDIDLQTMNPAAPVGTFVSLLCPLSCKVCGQAPPAPAPMPVQPPAPAAPAAAPACPAPEFTIRNGKFTNACVTAGAKGKKVTMAPCDADNKMQTFDVSKQMIKSSNGLCLSNTLTMVDCTDLKAALNVNDQTMTTKHIAFGVKCVNAKGAKALRQAKCNKKAKTQGWHFVVKI